MAHPAFVQVLDAADELPVELGCLGLVQTSISDDEVEKLAPVGMLHYHEELLLSLDDLVKLDDIGMANFLENFDLSGDPFNVLLVVDLFFLQNFDGHLFACQNMGSLLDLAKGALSQRLAEDVVANRHVVLVLHIALLF
eukprot:CAMPEP_0170455612 /NCGR_PEP_ID=MMETSP0123-20130129/3522_1 /TAXON_ID=182087 /ORGANISM="Favella ehrenbergii, Strain Fehren 1" /LENGTH=138 /DNA_ID=CAMNT_0010718815 /DNA_START=2532 /DNA_END=2948 /DNA_ORIENTATION=+